MSVPLHTSCQLNHTGSDGACLSGRARSDHPLRALESLFLEHPLDTGERERPQEVGAKMRPLPRGSVQLPPPAREHEEEEIGAGAMLADEPLATLEVESWGSGLLRSTRDQCRRAPSPIATAWTRRRTVVTEQPR